MISFKKIFYENSDITSEFKELVAKSTSYDEAVGHILDFGALDGSEKILKKFFNYRMHLDLDTWKFSYAIYANHMEKFAIASSRSMGANFAWHYAEYLISEKIPVPKVVETAIAEESWDASLYGRKLMENNITVPEEIELAAVRELRHATDYIEARIYHNLPISDRLQEILISPRYARMYARVKHEMGDLNDFLDSI